MHHFVVQALVEDIDLVQVVQNLVQPAGCMNHPAQMRPYSVVAAAPFSKLHYAVRRFATCFERRIHEGWYTELSLSNTRHI